LAGERLVRAMMQAGKTPESRLADIVMGEVLSINPLKIKVNKLELSSTFLLLSPFCYDKVVTYQHDDITSDLVIWEGLRVGDKVQMLRVSNGQLYYVMQKGE
jgi:hypothetical protein